MENYLYSNIDKIIWAIIWYGDEYMYAHLSKHFETEIIALI